MSDFMEKYGRIDLHLHLDGSLPAGTILKLADKDNIALPAQTEEGLRPYITAKRDCQDLNEYLRCFEIPLMILQTAENIEAASYELGRELDKKGLSYAEVRLRRSFTGSLDLRRKRRYRRRLRDWAR